MNLLHIGIGGARSNYQTKSVFAGNLLGVNHSMLKSTQEKMERQQKAGNEIAFWEKQKENLKEKECGTVEEIAKKLEMFHSYEDEIAAAKAAYNKEQMSHILDEAEEQGKKNAEAAEKLEPKTPEERREELVEEALGTEEDGSILDEMLDGAEDSLEEAQKSQEQLLEELPEEAADAMEEQLLEELEEVADTKEGQLLEELPEGADTKEGQLLEGLPEETMERELLGNLPEEVAETMEGQLLDKLQEELPAKEGGQLSGKLPKGTAQGLQEIRNIAQQDRRGRAYQSFDIRV